jgi:hypothetical protein
MLSLKGGDLATSKRNLNLTVLTGPLEASRNEKNLR